MLSIRSALPADAPAIAALMAELGYDIAPDLLRQKLAAVRDDSDAVFVALLGPPPPALSPHPSALTPAVQIVGFVSAHVTPVFHVSGTLGRITALIVSDAHRRRGIGRQLMATAEDGLRACGCDRIDLVSSNHRAEAHAFYRSVGYETTDHARFLKSFCR